MVDEGRFAELEGTRHADDHFGFVYGSRREQLEVVVPFLRRGVARGDQVVYVAADASPAEICAALRDAGVDVDAARSSGTLTFREATDVYLTDGEFDPERTVERITGIADSVSEDEETLRIAAEMSGSVLESIDPDTLLAYEATVDRLFGGLDVVALCQYDRSSFPPSFLEEVVECHPLLAYDGVVGSNEFYGDSPDLVTPPDSGLAAKLEQHRRTVAVERSLRRRESGIAALVSATEEVLWADPDSIPEIAVRTTRSALDCDHASLWLYDRESDALSCRYRSSAAPGERPPSPGPFDDLAWEAFVTNDEQRWSADLDAGVDVAVDRSAAGTLSAAVALPLAGTGVLVAASVSDRIGRERVEVGRALAGVTSVAFEKARQERRLEDQREELARRATVERILEDVLRTAAESANRRAVEQTLCESIASIDDVAFVWAGPVDASAETATPRTWAGEEREYVSTTVTDGPAPSPAVDAVSASEPAVVSRIADERAGQSWAQAALDRGFRSVASVPLGDEQVTYGAVTVYASRPAAFSDVLEDALLEVGQLAGSLLDVVEQTPARQHGQPREVEIELETSTFPFVELADELGCALAVEDVVAHGDRGVVLAGRLPTDNPGDVVDAADATDAIDQAELVEASDDGALLDLTLAEPFVGAALSVEGAAISSLTADPESARIVVELPASVGERTVVDAVAEEYPSPTLLATRRIADADSIGTSPSTVGSQFTDRQRQVAAVAYHAGYFDTPRRSTGEEVADVLDISPQAFYQHLRRMERTLFDEVVDSA